MIKDFKDFIMRGNVVDLAVAVIVGAAFTAVVNSFANDILMQIVAAVFGKPDFNDLTFDLGDAVIRYGAFITVLINFLIVAFVVFLVVKGINKLQNLRTKEEEEALEETEVELLVQIRDALVQSSAVDQAPELIRRSESIRRSAAVHGSISRATHARREGHRTRRRPRNVARALEQTNADDPLDLVRHACLAPPFEVAAAPQPVTVLDRARPTDRRHLHRSSRRSE